MDAVSHRRTCVACRRTGERDSLVRLAVVEGVIVVDGRRRLPGRGASLHPGPDCLALALRRRALSRAFPGAAIDAAALQADAAFQPRAHLGD